MSHYVISPAAERDIRTILAWTHEQFGESGRVRYESLLIQGIQDVVESPNRTGTQARPDIVATAKTYHLFFSRDRVNSAEGHVHRPRHFLLFRLSENGQVEIGRVLHDQVDLLRHLPDEYRPQLPR